MKSRFSVSNIKEVAGSSSSVLENAKNKLNYSQRTKAHIQRTKQPNTPWVDLTGSSPKLLDKTYLCSQFGNFSAISTHQTRSVHHNESD